jgi:cbb3-type cytochrome oxidase maturation protein
MKDYFYLIPIALCIGITALATFMWSLKNGQYDDLEGAAERILHEETDAPIRQTPPGGNAESREPRDARPDCATALSNEAAPSHRENDG